MEKRKRIDNPKRGCGHLKRNAMYLRADTHPDGDLPAFVVLTPPQPFVERHFRGWKPFQGLAFCIAGLRTDAPGGRFSTSPPGEPIDNDALITRLRGRGLPGDVGHADIAWAPDLLMWVGKDFYPTAGAFIEEAREHGVNKRIPAVGEPPRVVPGFTRLFLAHPHAHGVGPGVFGYTYLTRVLYTAGASPTPKWVDDLAAQGRVDVCEIGPEYDPSQATPLLDGLDDLEDSRTGPDWD